MKVVRWGIIGPGNIASTFAKAAEQCHSAKLQGVASRSVERAEAFAKTFGIVKVHHTYQALMADPEIDAVYIATPNSCHYTQARACLLAGKHVLLEKPATLNAQQFSALTALAEQNNLVLQDAIWSRFMPCLHQVNYQLEQGAIGQLQYISSSIGFAFQTRPKERLVQPALGGGALLDLGIYSIALSQFFMQSHPTKIQASAQMAGSSVDQTTLVNMQYASGVQSQFSCSITSHCANTMTLHGSEGKIVLPAMFWNTDQAVIEYADGTTEALDYPHKINGFEYQIDEMLATINAGKLASDALDHKQSLGIIQTMDEIRSQIGLQFGLEVESV